MTLGEAKNKVYMLLDEHSAGGEIEHDEDIEKKMTAFFDTAQKTLAQIRKIVRSEIIEPVSGVTAYDMPDDFRALYRVWADGRPATNRFRWRSGQIILPEGSASEVVIEYFALPGTIPPDAPDSYEFEIAPDACECMPYYVAAQQLLPDLVMDYGAMLQMYNYQVSLLATAQPDENRRGPGVKFCVSDFRQSQEWALENRADWRLNPFITHSHGGQNGMRADTA